MRQTLREKLDRLVEANPPLVEVEQAMFLPGDHLTLPTETGQEGHTPVGYKLVTVCSCGQQHVAQPGESESV